MLYSNPDKPLNSDPSQRPAWVDEKIMSYRPGLGKLASAFHKGDREKANDLVTDTIINCLDNWKNFRVEDGGFFGWLSWTMRSVYGNAKKKKRVHLVSSGVGGSATADGDDDAFERVAVQEPSQEHFAILSDIMHQLKDEPYLSDLIDIAFEMTNQEVADKHGDVSKQGVQQRVASIRRRLEKKVNA